MSDAIGIEVQFFLMSIIWGIILLVIYDVIRIFRRLVKHKWLFVALEDILFWIMSAVLIFRMMYQQNNGIIRGFSIIGMTLGMVVYNQSFSEFAVKYITKVFLFIGRVVQRFLDIISKPVRFISSLIEKVILFIKKRVTKIGNKLIGDLKKKEKPSKIKENKE